MSDSQGPAAAYNQESHLEQCRASPNACPLLRLSHCTRSIGPLLRIRSVVSRPMHARCCVSPIAPATLCLSLHICSVVSLPILTRYSASPSARKNLRLSLHIRSVVSLPMQVALMTGLALKLDQGKTHFFAAISSKFTRLL